MPMRSARMPTEGIRLLAKRGRHPRRRSTRLRRRDPRCWTSSPPVRTPPSPDRELATKWMRRRQASARHDRRSPHGTPHPRPEGADLDIEALEAALEGRTALEINANPYRLDLRDSHVRVAVDAGCRIAIDTDGTASISTSHHGVLTPAEAGPPRPTASTASTRKPSSSPGPGLIGVAVIIPGVGGVPVPFLVTRPRRPGTMSSRVHQVQLEDEAGCRTDLRGGRSPGSSR